MIERNGSDAGARLAVLAAGLVLAAVGGTDIDLVLLGVCLLFFGQALLVRRGYSAVLVLLLLFHWSGATLGAIHAGLDGSGLDEHAWWPGNHRLAVFLMLLGTFVLVVGIRLGAGRPEEIPARAWQLAHSRPLSVYFTIYAVAVAGSLAALSLAPYAGGLRAPLIAMAGMKWAAFTLLTMIVFRRWRDGWLPWLAVFALEFMLSLGGFFSSFKSVFLFTFIALWASGVRITGKVAAATLAGVVVLGFLGVAWTAVKVEFREYVSKGQREQVVLVDYETRVAMLYSMVERLSPEEYAEAADLVLRRLAYHAIFGAVLDRVPEAVPHAGGAIWGDALARPFMPRALFPNKTTVEDSLSTNYYSGIRFATHEEGTSVSLGYMAEAFIDFGMFLMFVPIFLLGWVIGILHRWLTTGRYTRGLVGVALVPVTLSPAIHIETSAVKLVAGLVLTALVALIASRIIVPMFLPWLMLDRQAASAGARSGAGGRVGRWSRSAEAVAPR